jgi:hypothetical protein
MVSKTQRLWTRLLHTMGEKTNEHQSMTLPILNLALIVADLARCGAWLCLWGQQ